MENKYINLLAKQVLTNTPNGLTKVKFAKILYFVHKGLVQKSLADTQDLKFIRMPLGPVPVGFGELYLDSDILLSTANQKMLSYDAQLYKLNTKGQYFDQETSLVINKFTDTLKNMLTSVLVDEAHKDPSWVKHKNGEEYFLEQEDLELPVPNIQSAHPDSLNDAQHVQAKLVKGMLDEIVEESTSLEYPAPGESS